MRARAAIVRRAQAPPDLRHKPHACIEALGIYSRRRSRTWRPAADGSRTYARKRGWYVPSGSTIVSFAAFGFASCPHLPQSTTARSRPTTPHHTAQPPALYKTPQLGSRRDDRSIFSWYLCWAAGSPLPPLPSPPHTHTHTHTHARTHARTHAHTHAHMSASVLNPVPRCPPTGRQNSRTHGSVA